MGGNRDTPYLAVDVDILEANIRSMADRARHLGVQLRPHAKTHKSLDVAGRQLTAGAGGLSVATVGEAERFVAGGFTDIFIAYPLWIAGERADRLRRIANQARIRLGVDSVEAARRIGHVLAADVDGTQLQVVVEVDSGHHRSGIDPAQAGDVAQAADDAGLVVAGVFTFPGHSYAPGNASSAADDEAKALAVAAESLERAGVECRVRSGGSTPSAAAAHPDVLNEIRPGVYVFNDAQQLELGTCGWDDIALHAVGTVVSVRGTRVIVDAGSKVIGADRPSWTTGHGRVLDDHDARIEALSEHHATVVFPDGAVVPKLGEQLRVVPNHVCNAVNLVDELVILEDGEITDEWPVSARGANR